MNKPTLAITVLAVAALLAGCGTQTATTSTSSSTSNQQESNVSTSKYPAPTVLPEDQRTNKQAHITMANGDEIVFDLFGDEAPLTVSNFIELTNASFYNGLTFHRVEPGFVVQGGDPSGNGTGGPGYKFKDETVTRDYTQGIVAMANSGPNTNGSQFFIMLADTPLPKSYTIFGKVTSGFEHVQTIKVGDVMKTVTIEAKK